MLALAVFLTPVLMSVPAFASDGEFAGGQTGGGRYDGDLLTIVKAMDNVADVMEQVWIIMVSNPLLVVFLAAALFTVGVRIFRKVKRSAKG